VQSDGQANLGDAILTKSARLNTDIQKVRFIRVGSALPTCRYDAKRPDKKRVEK